MAGIWRRFRPAIAGGVTLLALGIGLSLARMQCGRVTMGRAAAEVHEAFRAGNGSVIYKYTSPEERTLGGVPEQRMVTLVSRFAHPKLKGFEPVGEILIDADPEDQSLLSTQTYQHADGRRVHVGFEFVRRNGQPLIKSAVATVVFTAWGAARSRETARPKGVDRYGAWHRSLMEDRRELEEMGIAGFAELRAEAGKPKASQWHFVTWDQFLTRLENTLRRS